MTDPANKQATEPNWKTSSGVSVQELAAGVTSGSRRCLARAITLIESTRDDHRLQAEDLIRLILPQTGQCFRLGISGVPGVGKSTFIEKFGMYLVDAGHRVAVLAVDPSSPNTGGSILGDKTRMERLSRHPQAFIRPSPSSGTLGGIARRTRDVMLCVEAAGFDVVLIETVGVGQSEVAVSGLTDMFILFLSPAAGDDLQGIKKGIVELADLLIVNKADGGMAPAAEQTRRDYEAALKLLRPSTSHWVTSVMTCSALEGIGIENIWRAILKFHESAQSGNWFDQRRSDQAVAWMWDEITETFISELKSDDFICADLKHLEECVRNKDLSPTEAARSILQHFSLRSSF